MTVVTEMNLFFKKSDLGLALHGFEKLCCYGLATLLNIFIVYVLKCCTGYSKTM